MLTFEFPWPPRALSPNSRAHWRQVARMKAGYKEDCGWIVKGYEYECDPRPKWPLTPPVRAQVTFVCDRRRRDDDNTMAMLKPLWDAMVGVGLLEDDSHDKLTILAPKWEVGKPLVKVSLEEAK